ncbi:MAG: hypothetical protein R2942_04160 [Ignavibacteria bacterium]
MQVQIGEFNINPAKGMLMYYPEVNGNSEISCDEGDGLNLVLIAVVN